MHQIPRGIQPWGLQPFQPLWPRGVIKETEPAPRGSDSRGWPKDKRFIQLCGSTQNQRHERGTNNARSPRLASLRIVYKHSASLVYGSLRGEILRESITPKLRLCFRHLVIPSPLALLMLPHNGCLE